MKGKKVGIVTEGFEKCDEDVTNVVMAAANSLAKVGAQVEEVSIPLHREGNMYNAFFKNCNCCDRV